jgi:hypothetical protein
VDAYESEDAVIRAVEEGEDQSQRASAKAFVQVKQCPLVRGPFTFNHEGHEPERFASGINAPWP